MANEYSTLITLDQLSRFKTKADALYETKGNVSTLAGRVTALENDDSAANTIEIVKVNGTALTPDSNKAVNVVVPTTVAALTDAGDYALKTDLPTALSDLTNDNNTVTDASYVHTDNNFTDALLSKLNTVNEDAQVNVIEAVKVNGSSLTITSKGVDITVTEGTTNGTVKVNGVDVAVHGLGTAAYADTSAFGDDNVIETVKVNGTALTPSSKAVDITVPTAVTDLSDASNYALKADLGTAAAKDSETTLTDGANLPTGAAVKTFVEGKGYQTASDVSTYVASLDYIDETAIDGKISAAVSSVYKPAGSVAPSGVTSSLLVAANEGNVYNLSAAMTLDATSAALFVDGTAGDIIPAGTNIEVFEVSAGTYKFDKMAGFIDLSGYVQRSELGVATTAQIDALFA